MVNVPPARRNGFKFRKLNRWIVVGGVVVILGGSALVYAKTTHARVALPPGDLSKVTYGNVLQTVAAAGTIQPMQSINLNFAQSSGALATITATVGEHVNKGQVLATLSDPAAASSLQSAQAGLAQANAILQQDVAGPTPQTIALAQAAVQRAQITLAGATQQYQDLVAEDNNRSSQQQSLVSAQNQVTQDQAAIASAQANVSSAQIKLEQTQAGINTSGVNSLPATITADQNAVAADQTQLRADQQNLANAQQNLTTDQGNLTSDQSLYGTIASQYPVDEKAYQVALLNYNSWSGYGTNPYGSVVSSTGQIASQALNAFNTIQSAKSQVQTDQTAILTATKAIQGDQASIASAQAALTHAEDQQAGLGTSNSLTVQAAQVALQQAQASLAQSEASYKGAQASQALAQQVYNNQTTTQAGLDQANTTIQLDHNALLTAEAQLAQDEAPATSATIAGAKAAIMSATAQVAAATTSVNGARIVAPINGTIVASNYQVGDTVANATPVFILDSTLKSHLQVSVDVSEANLSSIHPGESVSMTTAAYSNQTFSGSVVAIEPNPAVVQNVTEYTVITTVNNTHGQLMPGMTTNVTIDTGSAQHVLTIPAVALQSQGTAQGVYVESGPHGKKGSKSHTGGGRPGKSGIRFVPIKVGLMGANNVQVLSGLVNGETILLVAPSQLVSIGNTRAFKGFGKFLGGGGHGKGAAGGAKKGGG